MLAFLTEKEILREISPTIEIIRVSLETNKTDTILEKEPHIRKILTTKHQNEECLRITIDFVLKEKLKNSGIGHFADMENFRKYFSFNIRQIIGKIENKEISFFSSFEKIVLIETKKNFRIFRDIEADGTVNYDYFHTVSFELKDVDPFYLSYEFSLLVNKEKFKEDFNIDLPGFFNNSSKYYYPVIDKRISDLVLDYKIQDFRNVDRTKKRFIDFSKFDKFFNKSLIKQNIFTKKITNNVNYFSNVILTRDTSGELRYLFFLDYKKLLLNESVFGKFFEEADFNNFFKSYKILSLKILRRRVKSYIKNEGKEYLPFDTNTEEDIVVVSKEKENMKLETVTGLTGVLKKDKIDLRSGRFGSTIKELTITSGNDKHDGVRFFSGLDKKIKNKTRGLYQYGVEIEIQDNTKNKFLEFYNILEYSKAALEGYLAEAMVLGERRVFPSIDSPHIRHKREQNRSVSIIKGNYDPVSNTFTDRFVSEQMSKYLAYMQKAQFIKGKKEEGFLEVQKLVDAPWIFVTFNYIKILSFLIDLGKHEIDDLEQFIISVLHPVTGSPKGITSVIKLIENLMIKISEIVGVFNIQQEDSLSFGSSKSSVRRKNIGNVIKIKKWFSNSIVDLEKNCNNGLDYLFLSDTKEENIDSLTVVTNKSFLKRMEKEKEKFSLDDNFFNSFSPSKIKFGKKVFEAYKFGENEESKSKSALAEIMTSLNNMERGFGKLGETLSDISSAYSKILLSHGVSISMEKEKSLPLSDRAISSEFLNVDSTHVNLESSEKSFGDKDILDKMTSTIYEEKKDKENYNFAAGAAVHFFHTPDLLNVDKDENGRKERPVQLMRGNLDFNKLAYYSPSSVIFRYNYMLLKFVEIFLGFEKIDDERQITLEKWAPLSKEMYKINKGRNILCRLKNYEDKESGFEHDKNLDLITYNEYFIMVPIDLPEEKSAGVAAPDLERIPDLAQVLGPKEIPEVSLTKPAENLNTLAMMSGEKVDDTQIEQVRSGMVSVSLTEEPIAPKEPEVFSFEANVLFFEAENRKDQRMLTNLVMETTKIQNSFFNRK